MRLVLLWFLLCCVGIVHSQEALLTDGQFPFVFSEGLLWVKVQLAESTRKLNFLLDSGAEVSVVDVATAKELGLQAGQRAEVRGVGVSIDAFWTSTRSAKANEVELPKRLLAVDLAQLSRSCASRVDGLIGADFFRHRAVQIDFRKSRVRIVDSGLPSKANFAPLEVRPCGLRTKASVEGKKERWFRIDTGCATALQWVTREVSSSNCSTRVAVGLAELRIPQTRTTVKIAGEHLSDVETGLHRSPIFDGEAGLLGNGLFSQFATVTIDTTGGKLIFGPRLVAGTP